MDRDMVDRVLVEMTRLREKLEATRDELSEPQLDVDRALWLAGILGHSPDVISIMDVEGRLQYVSRAVPGVNPRNLSGLESASFLRDPHRQVWMDTLRRTVATGESQTTEIQSSNGLWWHTRIAPIKREGQVTWLLSIGSDVTEQRRTEQQLTQARQERDLALEASGMGQWRWNVARDEVMWDAVTRRIFGWPPDREGITYSTFLERVHSDDRDLVRAHTQRTLGTGRYSDLECRIVPGDGHPRWILIKGKVLAGADGKPAELLGGVLDITESKEIDAGRRRMQKLEAIGQLAGGVAHDFNNLLVAIMGNVDMAKHAPEDRRGRMLDDALHACGRAAELTRQLLAFGRAQNAPTTVADLNDIVSDTLRLLRRLIPENIDVDFIAARQLPLVLADRAQIEQVIMNLSVNARDAMPQGGKLVLETEVVVINGGFRESHPWARPGRYVLLTVSDTGVGIPPGQIDQVFDPFFTTKNLGTGLGLATVYGIVKRHGGLIHVYSEPEKGSTFKVYLPVSERQASQVGTKIEDPVRGGRETILVAEDEEPVRAVVVRILAQAGYDVLPARDGVEAVEIFRCNASKVALVLLDAVMPRKNGAEALSEIRALLPDVAAVISSGYSETLGKSLHALRVEFLPKPYEPDALLRIVRRVLDLGSLAKDQP